MAQNRFDLSKFFKKKDDNGPKTKLVSEIVRLYEYETMAKNYASLLRSMAGPGGPEKMGQIPTETYVQIKEFFDKVYNEINKEGLIYLAGDDKIDVIAGILEGFVAQVVTETRVGTKDEEEVEKNKEPESVALSSSELSFLIEEYEKHQQEGNKDENEVKEYLKKFVEKNKQGEVDKLIERWRIQIGQVEKKLGEKDGFLKHNGAVLIVKKSYALAGDNAGMSPEGLQEILLEEARINKGRGLSTEQVRGLISSYNHKSEPGKRIGLLDSNVLKQISEAGEELYGARAAYAAAQEMAVSVLGTDNTAAHRQLVKNIFESMVIPGEDHINIQSLRGVVKNGENLEIAKRTIESGMSKFVSENPTLTLLAGSSALETVERRRMMLKDSVIFQNLDGEAKKEASQSIDWISNFSKDAYKDPRTRAVLLMARDAKTKNELTSRGAVEDLGALVYFASKGEGVEDASGEFGYHREVLTKYGFDIFNRGQFGSMVGSFSKAADIVQNPKNKAFFQGFKKHLLENKYVDKYYGSILGALKTTKAGDIYKTASLVLGVKEVVLGEIVGFVAEKGIQKAVLVFSKLGFEKLASGAASLTTEAGVKAVLGGLLKIVGIGSGPPGWLVAVVSWVANDAIVGSIKKTKQWLLKDGVFGSIFRLPLVGIVLVGSFVSELFETIKKTATPVAKLALIAVVVYTLGMGMWISTIQSVFVTPKRLNSFNLAPPFALINDFPGGIPPEDCPYGFPAGGDSLTQGPFGGYSHKGANAIDIAVPLGTAVQVTHSGTVEVAGWSPVGYGNLVVVKGECTHPKTGEKVSFWTYYAHNSSIAVGVGSSILKGRTIALAGTSGNSTGVHVHYELRNLGNILNFLPSSVFTILQRLSCYLAGPLICN